MPVLPAAPARLSMMTGWPSDICSDVARMRAMISVGPPGANGTINVIDRSGQAARADAAKHTARRIVKTVEGAKSRKKMAMTPTLNPFAAAPAVMKSRLDFSQRIRQSGLEDKLMELMKIRIANQWLRGLPLRAHCRRRETLRDGGASLPTQCLA